jgi:hypothetical protein
MCQNSSFAGTCSAVPSCSGDAVQCAQATAAFQLNCNAIKDDDSQVLARSAVAGNDPNKGGFPDGNNPSIVPIGTLDTTEMFTASCPQLPPIVAFGHSYYFNTQPLCDLGDPMGKLNVMVALIAALWIVSGSVRGA